jgi:S-DNA-T family DNA segregation ATPase FtsK/SpoIIIE
MTGIQLRETLLREYRVKVPSTGNRYPVDPRAIRARIDERDAVGSGQGSAE